jgi:hypothetical protein
MELIHSYTGPDPGASDPIEAMLGRLARPPRLVAVAIPGVHCEGRRLTIELAVQLHNPNWLGGEARDVRWDATVPGSWLGASGTIAALDLPARGGFAIRATTEALAGTLPPDLLEHGALPLALRIAMTVHTPLGTVHFGRHGTSPLCCESRVPLTTERLFLLGRPAPELLSVALGRPRSRAVAALGRTAAAACALSLPTLRPHRAADRVHRLLDCVLGRAGGAATWLPATVRLTTLLGIPLRLMGGVVTLLHDGHRVGRAVIGDRDGAGLPLGREVTALPLRLDLEEGTATRLRALLAAVHRHAAPLVFQGWFAVKPLAGRSIGPIREIGFNLTLGPENVRFLRGR